MPETTTIAPGSDRRLLIVSNRLPVSAHVHGDRVRLSRAAGGLATGLAPYHEGNGGVWIGWPGDVSRLGPSERHALEAALGARAIRPVMLSRDQIERYYHGYANRMLWPLFHDLIDRVAVDASGADAYRRVNEAFADVVAGEYRDGDTIWVHDYQLMLLPGLLRERLPGARIGFFLHIPFPSADTFDLLPSGRRLLAGLLGADLVGFHTLTYVRNFLSSLARLEGVEPDIDRVLIGDRQVGVGAFPMGVDADAFARLGQTPDVTARADAIRRDAGGRRIVLGVDRLDYTKGIPRRLQALERLFESDPALRDGLQYIQVAVPSRGEVDSYQRFRRQVEESVGRLNGTYGTLRSTPVRYMHQSVSMADLVALYRAADVMLVTPLRDGMNLVAKEFVASRADGDGVLVLSEVAGAASELGGAVTVNPYDVDAVGDAISLALAMPVDERRARMRAMRQRVLEHDVHAWAGSFLDRLAETGAASVRVRERRSTLAAALDESRRRHHRLRVLLDYDGTLVPIVRTPEAAAPDGDTLNLLGRLSRAPGIGVELVSGRTRATLEAWFGHLPIALWAEHGFWHRPGPGRPWSAAAVGMPERLARITRLLNDAAAATPGAWVETKTASVAWHYRGADADFGARQAHDLTRLLAEMLGNQPFEVLEGRKVVEVRLRGISKGAVARRVLEDVDADALTLAIGDDRTDEDLFRALPSSALTVAVGSRPTCAAFRLSGVDDVRRLLVGLLDAGAPDSAALLGGARRVARPA